MRELREPSLIVQHYALLIDNVALTNRYKMYRLLECRHKVI